MNRSDLIAAIANQTKMSQRDVADVLSAMVSTITLSLKCDEDVLISGFGKFEVRHKNAVTKRNPRTGQEVKVPSKRSFGFVPSAVMKEKVLDNPPQSGTP